MKTASLYWLAIIESIQIILIQLAAEQNWFRSDLWKHVSSTTRACLFFNLRVIQHWFCSCIYIMNSTSYVYLCWVNVQIRSFEFFLLLIMNDKGKNLFLLFNQKNIERWEIGTFFLVVHHHTIFTTEGSNGRIHIGALSFGKLFGIKKKQAINWSEQNQNIYTCVVHSYQNLLDSYQPALCWHAQIEKETQLSVHHWPIFS